MAASSRPPGGWIHWRVCEDEFWAPPWTSCTFITAPQTSSLGTATRSHSQFSHWLERWEEAEAGAPGENIGRTCTRGIWTHNLPNPELDGEICLQGFHRLEIFKGLWQTFPRLIDPFLLGQHFCTLLSVQGACEVVTTSPLLVRKLWKGRPDNWLFCF